MPIKGTMQPDILQVHKFQLFVTGLPVPFTLTSLSGIEDELDVAELPDRTNASGGRKKQVEFEIGIPAHHTLEVAQMELWFQECQDPVLPTHKKVGTVVIFSQSNIKQGFVSLVGLFPSKRAMPDLELDNDGEMAVLTYTMKADLATTFIST